MANHSSPEHEKRRASPAAAFTMGDVLKEKIDGVGRLAAAKAKTAKVTGEVLVLERSDLTVLRVTITPVTAKAWLLRNVENNRPVSSSTVSRYARDMKTGSWDVNGEPIKFTKSGKMIDGQHRLRACIESGVSFETVVVLGLENRTMLTLDSGLVRRPGDAIVICRPGLDRAHKIAAVLQYVWRYDNGYLFSREAPTKDEVMACLDKHPGVVTSTAATIGNKLAPAAVLAFSHYLFRGQDAVLAEAFFEALATGTNLNGDEPVFLLREKLGQNRAARAKLNNIELMALIFKAWNATKAGLKPKVLRWNPNSGEEFPHVEAPPARE